MKKLAFLLGFTACALVSYAQTNVALNFDGTNDHVIVNGVMSASYTKEAWVKRTTTGNNIISGGTTSNFGNHVFWAPVATSYKLAAGHNGTWDAVQDPTTMTINVWYHIAVTYDATTLDMHLYKNGVLVASN